MAPRLLSPSRIGKIVAIGRNYAAHAKELGNAVPTEPFFFLKPATSVIAEGSPIEVPKGCEVHHEVEVALLIGAPARDLPADASALSHVAGYGVALDLTARNLQLEARKEGKPWSAAKGFDTFTPLSGFIPASAVQDPSKLRLYLTVNGETRQDGVTSDMLFDVPAQLAAVSAVMTLEPGDVVLTGTPAGAGPLKVGDVVRAGFGVLGDPNDLATIVFNVEDRKGTGKFSTPI